MTEPLGRGEMAQGHLWDSFSKELDSSKEEHGILALREGIRKYRQMLKASSSQCANSSFVFKIIFLCPLRNQKSISSLRGEHC